MKKLLTLIMTVLILCIGESLIFAESRYTVYKITAEIDLTNERDIIVEWFNDPQLLADIDSGIITDVKVLVDYKLDNKQYVSEQKALMPSVDISSKTVRFNPFTDGASNAGNSLVTIRLAYAYTKDGKPERTDFSEPLTLGFDSHIKNGYSWSKNEINTAAKLGIILDSMKSDVKKPITRYEFIKMLMKTDDYIVKRDINTVRMFADNTEKDINAAYNLGLINGVGNNLFGGELNMTKEEMITIVDRYMHLFKKNENMQIIAAVSDLSTVSDWAIVSVNNLISNGIIKGNTDGKIEPKRLVTCEEAIVIVIRLFNMYI